MRLGEEGNRVAKGILEVLLKTWFGNVTRYTLVVAADINGFIPAAYHTVLRDEISDEGVASMVDGEYFLYWVMIYLCPILGNYELRESRYVVLMDNTTTHMGDKIEHTIAVMGAILVYDALF